VKGIAPFLTAPQAAGRSSRRAKAGKKKPSATADLRPQFEAALRKKVALKPSGAAGTALKGAETKAAVSTAPRATALKSPARSEESASEILSREKAQEKEKNGASRQEASAAPALTMAARVQGARKSVPAPESSEHRIATVTASESDAVSGTRKRSQAREAAAEAPRIVVTDMRKKPAAEARRGQSAENADIRQTAAAADRREIRAGATTTEGDAAPRTAVRSPSGEPGVGRGESAAREQPASPQVPVESLRDVLPAQLVRTAGIVVRDGNAGEIRLVLKPESLGSVRIRMSLGDDGIDGRIFVESQAVKEIFEGRLADLAQALRQGGFQNANLSVFVSGGDVDGRRREAEAGPSPRQAGREFERAVPTLDAVSLAGDYRVNLMA
jgi:flagellar hook-length control protein FliK